MRFLTPYLLAAIALLTCGPAQAEKRVALVIGNSAYQHAGELRNPRSDASDMSSALKSLGFDVIEGLDLDKSAMDQAIRQFSERLEGAKLGLFFFAGHGLQVSGVNYIVPVDAKLTTPGSLDFEAIRAELVQRQMELHTKVNVLFLDACRDNPLARNLARSLGTRSSTGGQGLRSMEAGEGTLISFATQPGNVALDGEGRNSPFTAGLVGPTAVQPSGKSALQAGGLFTDQHAQRVASYARQHNLRPPEFHIGTPPADLPAQLRRFVGVWVDDGQTRHRRKIMIITQVAKDGKADGFWVYGGPVTVSFGQYAGGVVKIAGTIAGNALKFSDPTGAHQCTLADAGKLSWSYSTKQGQATSSMLNPVWTLVEAERSPNR